MKPKKLMTIIVPIILVSCSSTGGVSPISVPLTTSTPTEQFTSIELSPEDEAAYQMALEDILTYRQGDLQIKLQDKNGNPLSGYQVKYRQISHDFSFGVAADLSHAEILKQAGLNTWSVSMDWELLQTKAGAFDFESAGQQLGIDDLKSSGWMVRANDLYPPNAEDMPPAYKDITYAEFLGKLFVHEASAIKRFSPAVDHWEAVTEPNFEHHNPLGLSKDEYFEAIATSIHAIRSNDPDAVVEITLSHPCGEMSRLDNFQTLQEMLDRNIAFDVLGLQFQQNAAIEAGSSTLLSFGETSKCYDLYAEMLAPYGKNITVEISAPSEAPAGQSGYWDIPWSEDTQAQYLVTAYSILFSKPSNQGLTWGDDSVSNSGLINDDGTPKKSYHALQRLIESWRTAGETITGDDGSVNIKGFGGDYEIEIVNPADGKSMTIQAHITEQDTTSEIVEVP